MDNQLVWRLARMSGRIWLIVEDENDGKVIQRILDKKQIRVHIKPLKPTGNSGGIGRLAAQLETLIESARRSKDGNDCIAVLHDADLRSQPQRDAHERIASICQHYRQEVKLV